MRVADILSPLACAGGYVRTRVDGRLEYVGPKHLLTDEIRDLIRTHKQEIRTWLRTPAAELPTEDRLAFGYQRTLPDWLVDRLFDDTLPSAGRVLDLCVTLELSRVPSRTRSMKGTKPRARHKRESPPQRELWT